jgi:hypothetical protein
MYLLLYNIGEVVENFLIVLENSIACCRCRKVVRLFKSLLSLYSLTGTAAMRRTALFIDQQTWQEYRYFRRSWYHKV